MAKFNFVENVCELEFGSLRYELPLNEDTLDFLRETGEEQIKRLSAIKGNDKAALDEAYNITLDGIDHILGDGAGEDIMSQFKNPGFLELGAVLTFITEEYSKAYKEAFEKIKATGTVLPPRRGGRK